MSARNILRLHDFTALRAELAQCAEPLYASGVHDVFASLEWFELLLLHGLGGPSQPVQLMLLHDDARQNWVCLPLLGSPASISLSNYYSSLFSGLCWSTQGVASASMLPEPQDCLALCQCLRQQTPPCQVLNLSPLDSESPFFTHMRAALSQAGFWVDSYFCFGNWYLRVDSRSFANYYPTLPSALRHSIARGQRRLQRHGPWHIRIQQAPDASLPKATAAFVQVYAQSWKSPEPQAQFIPELIHLAATQGWLRLGLLYLDERPVAAQLWLVKGAKAHIFKLAYVGGFERFSAGSVLTQAMMRHVLDVDQVQEVDYLTGDDAYKRDWMSHRRERRGLVAFAPDTVQGVWRAARHFVGKWLKARFARLKKA